MLHNMLTGIYTISAVAKLSLTSLEFFLLVTTRQALAMQNTAQLYTKKICDWEDVNKPHLLRQGP